MNMMTRSKRSMMIIVILLLFFSNVGTNCYASRPLSATSNGVDVAGGNANTAVQAMESTNKLANYLIILKGVTPPPGITIHH